MSEINIGDIFICVKDYEMESGQIAYTKGNLYECHEQGCLCDNLGDVFHNMEPIDDEFNEYFKKTSKSHIINCVNSYESSQALLKEAEELLNAAILGTLGTMDNGLRMRVEALLSKLKQ